jgi:hypothetical protein
MKSEIETSASVKQRHGCVTAWLILMIILNSLTAIIYLFLGEEVANRLPMGVSDSMLILLGMGGVANVLFSIQLLHWKKLGFWGFTLTAFFVLGINISIGLGIGQSVLGLLGIAVLYGVLQIKKDNISTWSHLE